MIDTLMDYFIMINMFIIYPQMVLKICEKYRMKYEKTIKSIFNIDGMSHYLGR